MIIVNIALCANYAWYFILAPLLPKVVNMSHYVLQVITDTAVLAAGAVSLESMFSFSVEGSIFTADYEVFMTSVETAFLEQNTGT